MHQRMHKGKWVIFLDKETLYEEAINVPNLNCSITFSLCADRGGKSHIIVYG